MKTIRTYVFVSIPISLDPGAHASSARRGASYSSKADGDEAKPEQNVRQDATHSTLEARAPNQLPFCPWFVYNSRPGREPS